MIVKKHKITGIAYEVIEWGFFSRFAVVRPAGRFRCVNKTYEIEKKLLTD